MKLVIFKDQLDKLLAFDDCEVEFIDKDGKPMDLVYIAIDQIEKNPSTIMLKFREK